MNLSRLYIYISIFKKVEWIPGSDALLLYKKCEFCTWVVKQISLLGLCLSVTENIVHVSFLFSLHLKQHLDVQDSLEQCWHQNVQASCKPSGDMLLWHWSMITRPGYAMLANCRMTGLENEIVVSEAPCPYILVHCWAVVSVMWATEAPACYDTLYQAAGWTCHDLLVTGGVLSCLL